ncbi:hypothetical protein SCHPADRAFT_893239 [Schizopora paradoxa]|uniref:Uncharacterized protein n=1 Tax=Schizopora paradoxa TaxID=27342 RepID=A0A0H2RBR7_9AGAM|nr:hypothetical protein SCHPADRAFT_893239 [Schizopora paradoxa]
MSNQEDQRAALINQIIYTLCQSELAFNMNSRGFDIFYVQCLNLLNNQNAALESFVNYNLDKLLECLASLEQIKRNADEAVKNLTDLEVELPPTHVIHPQTRQWMVALIQMMVNVLQVKQHMCGRVLDAYEGTGVQVKERHKNLKL